MKSTIQDREFDKFRPATDGKSKVAVTFDPGDSIPVEFTETIYEQILSAPDRLDQFTYADPGLKNERVTKIEYSSATIEPTLLARKNITYIQVGNNYIVDTIYKEVVSV